ncbi:OTU protein [Teratosphaeriaceae sp. CCFEE 6253]|nr:OTU protein [Teratosphaeriaceae sp. CCFEE 6253]
MDELQARHRKELRDLQSRITQKKKQASKKTRQGVNDECDALEADLKQQHAAEAAASSSDGAVDTEEPLIELLGELELKVDDHDTSAPANGTQQHADNVPSGEQANVPSQGKKPNKAKARLAKRAAEQEEQARLAAEEAKDLPNLRTQERQRMLEHMTERGLREKEIRADGHCLYSAVADQLEQLQVPLSPTPGEKAVVAYKVVRATAAGYIEQHPDDFVPFLEEPLAEHLHKIRETAEWGGQLELMALAKSYGVDINVLQDFGRVEKIESGASGEENEMWLGYYKHGFGLGEHYNSLRKTRFDTDDQPLEPHKAFRASYYRRTRFGPAEMGIATGGSSTQADSPGSATWVCAVIKAACSEITVQTRGRSHAHCQTEKTLKLPATQCHDEQAALGLTHGGEVIRRLRIQACKPAYS